MASKPFVGGVCVLFLSMILVGASAADDYSSSSEAPKTQPKIQSGSYEKPVAQSMPKPEESVKPNLRKDASYGAGEGSKSQPKIQSGSYEKPGAQAVPKPEESASKPQPKIVPDFYYSHLHSGEPTKPISDFYSKPTYKADPHYEMPKLSIPKPEEAFPAAVEGIVICKSSSGYVPIKGAVVTITCLKVNEEGYDDDKTPESCQSSPTNAKGYFFKTLPSNKDVNKNSWENCKAFLEQSPMEECGAPSNVNRGIDGFPLSSHRILQDKHLKLYSVGPFFYTPEDKPTMNKAPAGGY